MYSSWVNVYKDRFCYHITFLLLQTVSAKAFFKHMWHLFQFLLLRQKGIKYTYLMCIQNISADWITFFCV